MYANVNIPREEDFIFLVTALWHWYSKHTPSSLSLYSSPDEMEVKQVPPPEEAEEKKMAKEVSAASLNMEQLEAMAGAGAPAEEKKADAPKEEEKKEPAKEEEKKEEAPKEEDKKESESKEAEKEKPAEA